MDFLSTLLILFGWTAIGIITAKLKVLNKATFYWLNKQLFNIGLSGFIFLSIYNHFDLSIFQGHISILFAQVFFIVLTIPFLVFLKRENRRFGFNILAFQNSAYLPLPFLLKLHNHDTILLLLFLLLVGFNASLFSLGYWVMNRQTHFSKIINAPLVATILGILLSLFPHHPIPLILLTEKVWTQVLIPAILFSFGGVLILSLTPKLIIPWKEHIYLAFIKYGVFPVATVIFFRHADAATLQLMVIEAMMPPAVNLTLLPQKDKDIETINHYLLTQYLFFMLAIGPLYFILDKLLGLLCNCSF